MKGAAVSKLHHRDGGREQSLLSNRLQSAHESRGRRPLEGFGERVGIQKIHLVKDPRTSPARFPTRSLETLEEWILVVQPALCVGQVSPFALGTSRRKQSRRLASARDEEFLIPIRRSNDQFGEMGLRFRERDCLFSHISHYSHDGNPTGAELPRGVWPEHSLIHNRVAPAAAPGPPASPGIPRGPRRVSDPAVGRRREGSPG